MWITYAAIPAPMLDSRRQGAERLRFTLPEDADASTVDASFKDGVLAVAITKSKTKQSSTREIAVH